MSGNCWCKDVVQTCAMATTKQRVDTDTCKQIFRDHWATFQQRHPRYQERHVQAVIDNMLGCGTLEAGYTTYLCPHCLEEKRVAFSCKSSFCLSCCKVYVDEWVAHIGRTLYEGVSYRHVVLTMPDALHLEFYRDRPLLADLMQCGVAMRSDVLSWFLKGKLEAGYVVVLETATRGIRLRRDSLVSVMYSTELNSATSSVTLQRTDRHGILDEKPSDFQLFP